MAKKKKSRVPTPPRPVQAPRKRVEPRGPRRTTMLVLVLAVALIAAAAAVGAALVVRGSDDEGAAASGVCARADFPDQGRRHVQELPANFEYNSFPATSGPHYAQPRGPAIWNVYDREVPQEAIVHNLEHGGVVVQYGSGVTPQTVQQIVAWYQDDPNGIVVAPLPRLGDEIALTAWTHLATCSAFEEDAFSDFRDDYRGKGPERIPIEALQPGAQ